MRERYNEHHLLLGVVLFARVRYEGELALVTFVVSLILFFFFGVDCVRVFLLVLLLFLFEIV